MDKFKKYFNSRKKRKKKAITSSVPTSSLDNNTNPYNKGIYLNPPYGTEGRQLTPGGPNV